MISNAEAQACRPDGVDLFKLRIWYRKKYLKTVWWEERRMRALELAVFQCEACTGAGNVHVHHLTYHRLFQEENGDLMCLCGPCHKLAHDEALEKAIRGMDVKEKKAAVLRHCRKKNASKPPVMTFKLPTLRNRRK